MVRIRRLAAVAAVLCFGGVEIIYASGSGHAGKQQHVQSGPGVSALPAPLPTPLPTPAPTAGLGDSL